MFTRTNARKLHEPHAARAAQRPPRDAARRSAEGGFSIIELLVGITLFIIIAGAVYGLMNVASSDRFTTNTRAELTQNLRIAMSAIERDALDAAAGQYPKVGGQVPNDWLNATFAGVPLNSGSGPDFLTPVISGHAVNANNLNTSLNTDQVTFVYKDPLFNNGSALPLQSLDTSGPGGTYKATIKAGYNNSVCTQNDLYLISGGTAYAVGVMTNAPDGTTTVNFGNPSPLNINKTSSTGGVLTNVGANPTMYRLRMVTFRVLPDGTLVRTVYGSDQTNSSNATGQHDEPLAYNVSQFQLLYAMKDGTTTTDPLSLSGGVSNLQNIIQVSITMSARSTVNDPRTQQPVNGSITGTFTLRNLEY